MNDNSLDADLRSAMEGSPEAFRRIYETHKQRIFHLCFRMVRSPSLAEDLTQDVFLQLFRKINTFRNESAFSTWLHRMAVNVVLMHLRSYRSGLDSSLDAIIENGVSIQLGRPDSRLMRTLDRMNLFAAIDALPTGYQTVFLLHDVEGYEHNEIAEILGCSIGNSKSQLHKARLKLRGVVLGGITQRKKKNAFKPIGEPQKIKELRENITAFDSVNHVRASEDGPPHEIVSNQAA